MSHIRKCNHCTQSKPQQGGAIRFLCGHRLWVCAACKDTLAVKTYGKRSQPNQRITSP